jgi:hypothetical protein
MATSGVAVQTRYVSSVGDTSRSSGLGYKARITTCYSLNRRPHRIVNRQGGELFTGAIEQCIGGMRASGL